MILQHVGNKQLVYVKDYKADYMDVAKEFGMLDNAGHPLPHVVIESDTYKNDNGIAMPAYRLNGRTVDLYVVNDSIVAKSTGVRDIAEALNYFPSGSRLPECGFTFVSPFRYESIYLMMDSNKQAISFNAEAHKDIRGIFDIMTHLDLNNGKLFEPVIARYYELNTHMPKNLPLVGYINLEEYLKVLRDDRRNLFLHNKNGKYSVLVKSNGHPPRFSVTMIQQNCAVLSVQGWPEVLNSNKVNSFDPFIVFCRRPFELGDAKLPWSKVYFANSTIFMHPVMSKNDVWASLKGGKDLLTP